jgi:hypothetical protein
MESRVDQCRKQYALALFNLLASFTQESGRKAMDNVVEVVDQIAVNQNWFHAGSTAIRTGLWDEIRNDVPVHMTLVKFERICLSLMTLEGIHDEFMAAINTMFMNARLHQSIVDKDFVETMTAASNEAFTAASVPGLVGVMSVIMFRDLWTVVQK